MSKESEHSYYEKLKPYVWPWLAIPIAVLYAADFAHLLLNTVETLASAAIVFYFLGSVMGMTIYLHSLVPGSGAESLLKLRFVKYVPTIQWGYRLSVWLTEDLSPKEEPEESQPEVLHDLLQDALDKPPVDELDLQVKEGGDDEK